MNYRMHRANGILLHYVTAGQGEPVVLLNGSPRLGTNGSAASFLRWPKNIS